MVLPQLQFLDGTDRQGNPASDHDLPADIPGLDQYMEYLLSSSGLVRNNRCWLWFGMNLNHISV